MCCDNHFCRLCLLRLFGSNRKTDGSCEEKSRLQAGGVKGAGVAVQASFEHGTVNAPMLMSVLKRFLKSS